jgi:hypothetical protein
LKEFCSEEVEDDNCSLSSLGEKRRETSHLLARVIGN